MTKNEVVVGVSRSKFPFGATALLLLPDTIRKTMLALPPTSPFVMKRKAFLMVQDSKNFLNFGEANK